MKRFVIFVALVAASLQSVVADDLAPIPLVLPPPAMKGTPQALPTNTTALPLTSDARPPFMAPKGAANVALNKPVSASDINLISGDLKQITDGKKEAFDENVVTLRRGLRWVQ